MKSINVGILGLGVVGTGVAKLLINEKKLMEKKLGFSINLKKIAVLNINKERDIDLSSVPLTDNPEEIINDPEISIVIETIGGFDVAKQLIEKAIQNGKNIVTANKALIALHGNSLMKMAEEKGVDIGFEASVGGCMPIVKLLRESLVANDIQAVMGILNGTCNYILSEITHKKISFEEALKEAQEKGFAEADPSFDIEGIDSAHKLCILNSIAYGIEIDFDNIYVEGIKNIKTIDIKIAEEFGYKIKLLAISKKNLDMIEARVHPVMVHKENMLSNVSGALNSVLVSGSATNDIVLYGYGAGMMPTASAILSDVVDIGRNIITGNVKRIPIFSYRPANICKSQLKPMSKIKTKYYLRIKAVDRAGVLGQVAKILGDNNVSVNYVKQEKEENLKDLTYIIILTHKAVEENIQNAIKLIANLDVIVSEPTLIRIENDKEDQKKLKPIKILLRRLTNGIKIGNSSLLIIGTFKAHSEIISKIKIEGAYFIALKY